jgi:malonyl-CoA/methylmalonyl-CoA synthetase
MTEIRMALSNPLRGERRPGTVGKPLPGVEMKLISENSEDVMKEGVPGKIHVRGATVFLEYWKRPEATREAFRVGGCFRTGDIGMVEEGYYRILSRNHPEHYQDWRPQGISA